MTKSTVSKPRERVLTGIRSNEMPTIANYLGGMHPMVELVKKHADTHEFFMFVPDLHSFTTPIDHDSLYTNTIRNIKFFVAAGAVNLKNDNVHVYRQSYVPAHSELAWILDCFTYMGEASRMTHFKEKAGLSREEESENTQLLEGLVKRTKQLSNRLLRTIVEHDLKNVMRDLKHESISVGLFNYPVLMAADILLYNAKYVPVGDDQRQHLELCRDIALRMNEKFKDLFPEGVFETVPLDWKKQLKFSGRDQGLRIRSLRNPKKKMSKSDADAAGSIFLLDNPAKAAKKIMAATTDSEGSIRFDWNRQPGITNLLQLLALLEGKDVQEVVTKWQGKSNYGDLKREVAKAVEDFLTDFQNKFNAIDEKALVKRLERDEELARQESAKQLLRVQQAVGLRPQP